MAEKPNLVHVEIFGQTYAVRAGGEPGFVEELAAQVDAQMREVSKQSGAVDTVRIAVLAALNIAAELREVRARIDQADDKVRLRAEMLARVLSSAIDG
ncbi:MAG: cell division protein ZapA [Vicinamibacteria bacterium]